MDVGVWSLSSVITHFLKFCTSPVNFFINYDLQSNTTAAPVPTTMSQNPHWTRKVIRKHKRQTQLHVFIISSITSGWVWRYQLYTQDSQTSPLFYWISLFLSIPQFYRIPQVPLLVNFWRPHCLWKMGVTIMLPPVKS